jgi:hypothetical protein
MLRVAIVLLLAFPLVDLSRAQAEEDTPQVKALIELARNNISPHLMIAWIEGQPSGPTVDQATLLTLTRNRVPDSVIEALVRHNAARSEPTTVTATSGGVVGSRVVTTEPSYIAPADRVVASAPYSYSYSYPSYYPYYDSYPYSYSYYPSYYPGLFISGGFFPRHHSFFHSGFGFRTGFGFRGGFHHR